MKIFVIRAAALVLIFALLTLAGCGKDNITFLSSNTVGEASLRSDSADVFSSDNKNTENSSSYFTSSTDKNHLKNEVPFPVQSVDSLLQNTASDNLILQNGAASGSSSGTASSDMSGSVGGTSSSAKKTDINFKGIWISYYEFPFWGSSEEQAKEKFSEMMKKVAMQGYNAVFCHVRANADAFYPSKYFPFAMQLTGKVGGDPGYDPLKIMIWAAKKYKLQFHAWINPYRVSNLTTNPNELAEGHIAAKWLADGSNRAVVHNGGIYFNPSSTDVQRLVLYGIREILAEYDVDGIHFDDYFYPENITPEFDSVQYKEYKQAAEIPLSLADWRRANVSTLVSAAYNLCHQRSVTFGISPAGNMSLDNSHDNYNLLYADIALWMRSEGYVDYIIPQLYFGYNHPVARSRYEYLLNVWSALPKHKNLKLYIGLGAYRMDEACDDSDEWHYEADLMARQVTDARLKGANGIAVFSYTASMSENPHNALQIENMFDAINSK